MLYTEHYYDCKLHATIFAMPIAFKTHKLFFVFIVMYIKILCTCYCNLQVWGQEIYVHTIHIVMLIMLLNKSKTDIREKMFLCFIVLYTSQCCVCIFACHKFIMKYYVIYFSLSCLQVACCMPLIILECLFTIMLYT